MNQQDEKKMKERAKKTELILSYQVTGEAYIATDSSEWKHIVLNHFNRVQRGDNTLNQLLSIMKHKGVVFSQHDSLVKYPVKECLEYIAKITDSTLEMKELV